MTNTTTPVQFRRGCLYHKHISGDSVVREKRLLDGKWDFQFNDTPQPAPRETDWGTIHVPLVWQAQFDDLRNATGTGWYQREIDVSTDWADSKVILHIGAAYHITTVWLNGAELGTHSDGYLPFEVDLTPALSFGQSNHLRVRVVSPSDDEAHYPDYPFSQIPHGKQSWYGHLGGIWQSIWLERRPSTHIEHVALKADLKTGELQASVTLNRMATDYACTLDIDGTTHQSSVSPQNPTPLSVTVDHPRAWSPDTPHLYTVSIKLHRPDGTIIDRVEKQTGFRSIETRDGSVYLNGKPFYLRGALDQDYYPETITTPPSVAFLEDQMHKVKAMGLNCLRTHIKLADPRYYEAADRIGILLWVDYPNWAHTTERTMGHVKDSLRSMLCRDGHHPSIAIWTLVNEDWGTDLVGDSEHRIWLREMYHWLKAVDPTRLVVDNSPCFPNFHVESDINDYHYYAAMPDNIDGWDAFITDFSDGDYPTYSPHGDAVQNGDEPRILSEFGTWGLPDLNTLSNDDGTEPWWTETGSEWGDGTIYPHGMQHRFKLWHLNRAFGSWENFIAASQWHQYHALAHQIDTIRREPRINGYVITELTDVYWEANGLLDLHRRPKTHFSALPSITGETTLIPQFDRLTCLAGETLEFAVQISHHGSEPLFSVRLVVADPSGEMLFETYINRVDRNPSLTIPVSWQAPGEISAITSYTFAAQLTTSDETVITTRTVDVTVCPRYTPELMLWTSSERLRIWVSNLGYQVVDDPSASDLILADQLTPALTEQVRKGCRALLLAETTDAIPSESADPNVIAPFFPYTRVVKRQNTVWEGNWASTLAWVHLPGFGKHAHVLDKRFKDVIPKHVLVGFKPLDFQSQVFAGLFAGWIQRPVALAARRRYGRGHIMISTFQLTHNNGSRKPLVQSLFRGLTEKAKGQA
jgi:hypothetical protein